MTTKLSFKAQEGSTLGIVAEFTEKRTDIEETVLITPNAGLTWSLTDLDGNIINDRDEVELVSASSVLIVLSGNDLALSGGYPAERCVTVEGTYNSVLGNNLTLKDAMVFQIENLVGVP